jgi:multifunctional 2-oxoglutarate metabolism enzyme
VTQAGANTPANHFGGTFGPNEWLVQEMYERYQQDPASVDKAWWDFFADFKGGASTNGASANPTPANQKGVPPIPKSQQAAAPVAQQVQQPVATPAPLHLLHQCQPHN